MMLRSSSTPVLGSLLSSFSDSPNNSTSNHHHDHINTTFKHSPVNHQSINKLQGLLDYYSNSNDEQCYSSNQTRKVSGRSKCLMLETIPSFSFNNLRGCYEDDDEEDEDQSDVQDEEERAGLEDEVETGKGHFGLSNKMENMVLAEEVRVMDRIWNVNFEEKRERISEEMHLARGPGIDCGGNGNGGWGGFGGRSGGGSGGEFDSGGGDGGDMHGTEEYYKRMVHENPGNPLVLRNYAQFLYQTKRDLQGAEEYYSRAILADPKDGEILSQYGRLVWESHQDHDRASSYFERGVQASPEDCHVHAAYASFLWETEGGDGVDGDVPPKDVDAKPPRFLEGAVAFARG